MLPKTIGMKPEHVVILLEQNEDNYEWWEKGWKNRIEKEKDNYEKWEEEWKHLYELSAYERLKILSKNPEIRDTRPPYYTSSIITKVANFFRELSKLLDTEIEILLEAKQDYICSSLCDNYSKRKRTCKYEEYIKHGFIDLKPLDKYNLSLGQKITVGELFEQYRQLAKISAPSSLV
jgi:hypothetical protein